MSNVESLISSELERMLPLPDGGRADWAEVLHRAGLVRAHKQPRLSRRSIVAIAAAVVVGLAIAVPASGLTGTVRNWFKSPTAPGRTQKDFASLDIGAPKGMAPHVSGPARSVMEVQIGGKQTNLWVAPTANGGFCLELESYGAGCDRSRQLPLNPTIAEHTAQTPVVVFGDVLSSQVDHVDVRFASGQGVSIPVVYVSAPINASFFAYQLPAVDSRPEWPTTFQAIRADGTVITSNTLHGSVPPQP
jgi:hypothetical protein